MDAGSVDKLAPPWAGRLELRSNSEAVDDSALAPTVRLYFLLELASLHVRMERTFDP